MLPLLLAHGSSGDNSGSILSVAVMGAVAAGFGVRALVARRRRPGHTDGPAATENDARSDPAPTSELP